MNDQTTTSGTGYTAATSPKAACGDLSITVMCGNKSVAGVQLTVTSPKHTDSGISDGNGLIVFPKLPADTYTLDLAQGTGYTVNSQTVTVTANQTNKCTFAVTKQTFPLKVQTYLDSPEHCGTGRQAITGATVEVYQAGQSVACKTTPADLNLEAGLTQFFVRAPGGAAGRSYKSSFEHKPLSIQFDGLTTELDIPLSLKLAELQVSAGIVDQDCSSAAPRPFTDFTAQLYRGTRRDGMPLRKVDSNGLPVVGLSDLESGLYTLLVTPSASHTGSKLVPADAHGSAINISVSDGQCVQLPPVLFRVSEGRVSARAITANGTGLPGVSLVLTPGVLIPANAQAQPRYGKTDKDGYYSFGAVEPGSYTVSLVQEVTRIGDIEYVSATANGQTQSVLVAEGQPEQTVMFNMIEDVHQIIGTVKANGKPVANALVYISDEFNNQSTTTADASGKYQWTAPRAGTYEIWVDDPPKQRYKAAVNSVATIDIDAGTSGPRPPSDNGGNGRSGGGGGNGDVKESFIDLQAYPILTESISSSSMPATATSASSGGGGSYMNLGQTVDNALKDVLSWRPKANDPKSFMTALTQSFDLTMTEGHTEFTWKPKSYTVQTDLGAVTGAQASIYTRAKVALDQSMPLLAGLYPLNNEVLPEDLDSMRVVISTSAKSVVDEFGREGGPRVPRVDQLFTLLLGPNPVTDPEEVGGQLQRLRRRFGLERRFVNTIDDEQNLTNFLILVDYLSGLQTSWNAQKPFFTRSAAGATGQKEPFFGTQLVLLSRAVEVITQSVQDVYFAMDSVFLGAAERATVELDFAGESSLFADELLEWTLQASQEGLQYLRDGGKDGIDPFRTTIDRVRNFVRGALLQPLGGQQDPSTVPPGYKTPRVQRAILDLANQLDEASRLAAGIHAPRFEGEANGRKKTQ